LPVIGCKFIGGPPVNDKPLRSSLMINPTTNGIELNRRRFAEINIGIHIGSLNGILFFTGIKKEKKKNDF